MVQVAANKALELEPNNAEAYVALARGNIQDSWLTIRGIFEKAYELAPSNPDVLNFYGDFTMITGDFKSAESLEQKAIELDPLAAVHYSDMAFVMYAAGRFEEGLKYARTSASLEPDSLTRNDGFVVGLSMTGQFEQAALLIKRLEQLPDTDASLISWWWSLLYYQQGDLQKLREKASERVQEIEFGAATYDASTTALTIAWLDGVDAALPMFKIAYERQEYNLILPEFFYLPEDISDDPDWLAFWQQPRLAELMEIRRSNKTGAHIGYWKERPKS
jgi:tetratricopeptide (TPR) repeat protein